MIPVRLVGHADRPWDRPRARHRHRCAHGNRPHRHLARCSGERANAVAAPDAAAGAGLRGARHRVIGGAGRGLSAGCTVPGCEGILAGITLAMATLPEEFPLVLTVFLVLGAWRMSQSKVLTRRSAAVEALGAATVLCTDKTGTLTQNRMAIREAGRRRARPVDRRATGRSVAGGGPRAWSSSAILASRRDPFDPMERAFATLGSVTSRETEHMHADWTLLRGYPLSPDLLAMSHVWQATDRPGLRGGREGRARGDRRFVPPAGGTGRRHPPRGGGAGRRGAASAGGGQGDWSGTGIGRASSTISTSSSWACVGLADPVRPEGAAGGRGVPHGGIRVVMITGDHPTTATAHRPAGGHRADGRDHHRRRTGRAGRCRAPAAGADDQRLRPHGARSRSCAWCRRSRPTARSSR